MTSFQMGGKPTLVFPRIQGADIAGRIVAVGDGVDDSRIGERGLLDFGYSERIGEFTQRVSACCGYPLSDYRAMTL
jgi:NADPH:quinone reductase-like Zn-dependent oxidoreductase